MASKVKYPNINVQLSGMDGNIYLLIGRVSQAMQRDGVKATEIKAFRAEVMDSKSYDGALQTIMRWVEVY